MILSAMSLAFRLPALVGGWAALAIAFIASALTAHAATVEWSRAHIIHSDPTEDGVYEYLLVGKAEYPDGTTLSIDMFWSGYGPLSEYYMKGYCYGTMDQIYSSWVHADKGHVLNSETLGTFVPMDVKGYIDSPTGGVKVPDPSNFYLGLIYPDDSGKVDGGVAYGWINLSIDENYHMTVLGTGIDVTGASVVIGELIPEPTSGMLMLFGFGLLGLRRRRRGIV